MNKYSQDQIHFKIWVNKK